MTRSPFCLGSTCSWKGRSPTRRSRTPHWSRMSRTPMRTRLKCSTAPCRTRSSRSYWRSTCHRRTFCYCYPSCTHSFRSSTSCRLRSTSLCRACTFRHYSLSRRPLCTKKQTRCMLSSREITMNTIRCCWCSTFSTSSGTIRLRRKPSLHACGPCFGRQVRVVQVKIGSRATW